MNYKDFASKKKLLYNAIKSNNVSIIFSVLLFLKKSLKSSLIYNEIFQLGIAKKAKLKKILLFLDPKCNQSKSEKYIDLYLVIFEC